jgi:biofilm PGA synthesis N-glycosyltransferase PgaC
LPCISDISTKIGTVLAILVITGIALIPGFANAFLVCGLLLDRRPNFNQDIEYNGISILIAAFNEAVCIKQTLDSINKQEYDGPVQVIIIDDGSTDDTVKIINDYISALTDDDISSELIVQPKMQAKLKFLMSVYCM